MAWVYRVQDDMSRVRSRSATATVQLTFYTEKGGGEACKFGLGSWRGQLMLKTHHSNKHAEQELLKRIPKVDGLDELCVKTVLPFVGRSCVQSLVLCTLAECV